MVEDLLNLVIVIVKSFHNTFPNLKENHRFLTKMEPE